MYLISVKTVEIYELDYEGGDSQNHHSTIKKPIGQYNIILQLVRAMRYLGRDLCMRMKILAVFLAATVASVSVSGILVMAEDNMETEGFLKHYQKSRLS